MLEGENPGLVYDSDDGDPGPTRVSHVPLVLIHDGGGTTFSYYCLNPIGRRVYAIHNPSFYTGTPWTGGIPEMARHYVSLLQRTVPRGRIMLGGWSLGGILALEMSRILAEDSLYSVIGIVMIDSISPDAFRSKALSEVSLVPHKQVYNQNTRQETIEGMERCFAEARKSIESYHLPSWDLSSERASTETGGTEKHAGTRSHVSQIAPPRAILLRAKDSAPAEPGEVGFVDVCRDDRQLGWGPYRKGLFHEIIDIPGHHFNVFAWEHIETVSEELMDACRTLENLATS